MTKSVPLIEREQENAQIKGETYLALSRIPDDNMYSQSTIVHGKYNVGTKYSVLKNLLPGTHISTQYNISSEVKLCPGIIFRQGTISKSQLRIEDRRLVSSYMLVIHIFLFIFFSLSDPSQRHECRRSFFFFRSA